MFDNGKTENSGYGDIIEVDKDGHFYYSDEYAGIVEYKSDKKKYVKYYHGTAQELNIMGFYDLSLKEGGSVVKTQYKQLLNNIKD